MTNPLTPEQLDQWVLAYLDGALDEASFAQLTEAMRTDPATLDRFVELAMVDRSLLDTLAHGEQVDAMNRASHEQADPALSFEAALALLGRGSESAQLVHLHGDLTPRHRMMPYFVGAAIAAVLVLAVTLTFVFSGGTVPEQDPGFASDPTPTPDNTVATLTATHNAKWAEGALAPGSQLRAGTRLTLTAGFAEITTNRGAIAILEAPTTVELTNNDNALHLHSGKLVGICETESSKGFLVRTPQMDVTDLGTRFGVEVPGDQQTVNVQVYEGLVHARTRRDAGLTDESVLIHQQEAIVFHTTAGIQPVAFSQDRYTQNVVQDALKPRFVEGDVQWFGQLSPKTQHGFQESNSLSVFIERSGLTLKSMVKTDLGGENRNAIGARAKHTIQAGQAVDVYLLHLDVPGSEQANDRFVVRFDRPILGVITSNDRLIQTDSSLGAPGLDYRNLMKHYEGQHGLEASPSDPGTDTVAISEDRLTLMLDLSQNEFADQVRVLVQSEGQAAQ